MFQTLLTNESNTYACTVILSFPVFQDMYHCLRVLQPRACNIRTKTFKVVYLIHRLLIVLIII